MVKASCLDSNINLISSRKRHVCLFIPRPQNAHNIALKQRINRGYQI